MAETTTKTYPHSQEDIDYEKEIVDAIKKLPIEQRFQAIALNHYTLIKKRLDDEVDSEIDKIVIRYNALQAPLATRNNELISGEKAATTEETADAIQYLNDEEKGKVADLLTADPVPEYWFKVLNQCARINQDIFEVDHPLLKAITKIDHIPSDDNDDFALKFHFASNEYFENESLQVKFFMIEDGQDPLKTEGTEIKWKTGKDITKKTISKKQKNKKTGKSRTVEKVVDADSFFNFFRTLNMDGQNADDDDEEGNETLERLNINFDIATAIQEEIIPYHLEYYLGLRKGDEYGDMDFGGDDDGDDDDDDDDEDDKPPKKGGNKSGNKPVAGDKPVPKQDCKQQ